MCQGRSISERFFLFITLKAAADYGRNQANALSQVEVFGFRMVCRQYGHFNPASRNFCIAGDAGVIRSDCRLSQKDEGSPFAETSLMSTHSTHSSSSRFLQRSLSQVAVPKPTEVVVYW